MKVFRYIEDAPTLKYDREKCIGCGLCVQVCPHRIFSLTQSKADLTDTGICMECGACAKNCPVEAISVSPGVGCAAFIINAWLLKMGKKTPLSVCC